MSAEEIMDLDFRVLGEENGAHSYIFICWTSINSIEILANCDTGNWDSGVPCF